MIFFESFNHALSKNIADICRVQGSDIVDLSSCDSIDDAITEFGTPSALVLTPPQRCEAKALQEAIYNSEEFYKFGKNIHTDAMSFLSKCRTVTQKMVVKKSGHVLFVGVDDVASRLVGLPQSPIANGQRISAMKSLAKEYSRVGINYSAIITQPSQESLDPKVWRDKRSQLKVYTMRFSPYKLHEYAAFCAKFLDGSMPLNGGLINLGKG